MKFAIIGNLEKPGLGEAVRLLVGRLEQSEADYVVDTRIVTALGSLAIPSMTVHAREMDECIADAEMIIALTKRNSVH